MLDMSISLPRQIKGLLQCLPKTEAADRSVYGKGMKLVICPCVPDDQMVTLSLIQPGP